MKFSSTDVKVPIGGQHMDGTMYVPEGNDEPYPGLLILHGRGSRKERFIDYAEALAGAGFATLIFSYRGHGESDGDIHDQTVSMNYDDVLVGYDYLTSHPRVNQERVGVYAGSFGGYLASFLSNDRPVHALILAAPGLYRNEWWNRALETVPKQKRRDYRNGTDFGENDAIAKIRKYTGPLLLIRHENDELCPMSQTRYYFENADSAVLKEKRVIKNAPHSLFDEKHRKESIQTTVDWFRRTLD